MTAAEQFYLAAITFLAAVVVVMLALVIGWRVAWLVIEASRTPRGVGNDADGCDEYRERAS